MQNSDNDEASLEGHTLQVQAFSRTNGQSTELPICNHHESPSADYASYSGQPVRAPFDRHKEYVYVFSVPSSSFGQPHPVASVRPHDVCLVATLTFGAKLLQVRLHNNSPPSSARNLQSSNSSQISSTTSCAAPSCSSSSPSSSSSSSSSFSPSFSPFASLSSSSSSSSLSSAASKLIPRNSYGHCSSSGHFSSLFDPTSSSSEDTTIACASSSNHLPTSSNICSSSSSSSSSAFFSSSSSSSGASSGSSSSAGGITQICKLRVGITRFGVSLLPSQMNDFKCVYKFSY